MPQAQTHSWKWAVGFLLPIVGACLGWAARAQVAVSRLEDHVTTIQAEQDRRRGTIESVSVLADQLERIVKTTDKSAEQISEINTRQAQMQADIAWMKQKLNK